MKFFDVSLPLRKGMIVWPGDIGFQIKEQRGSGIVSHLNFSTHTGTHIDAPKHFLFSRPGVDRILPTKLIGKCKVIRIDDVRLIEPKHLRSLRISRHDKILFQTENRNLLKLKKFTANYVSLSLKGAKYLVSKKIDLVGIDYYGIEAKSAPGHPVHKSLLRAGIVIVEGLDLSKIRPGKYNMAALPLKITRGDGSPARVVLWK